mgnify:CR=1 FL=1
MIGNLVAGAVRVGHHDHALAAGRYLAERAKQVLAQMGAKNISGRIISPMMMPGMMFQAMQGKTPQQQMQEIEGQL